MFWILRKTVGIRCSEEDEFDGLDLTEHDINAYPDFQQTMIKSYHLCEAENLHHELNFTTMERSVIAKNSQ